MTLRLAVVGLGRAGSERVKTVMARSDCSLFATVSRRQRESPSFDDLLNSEVDGVLICRESHTHAKDVEQALLAGKHVLVEYPLAFTGDEARALMALAQSQGTVLHVGYFAQLNPAHSSIGRAITTGEAYRLDYHFQAGFGGLIRDQAEEGLWGQSANSRLQALWDWVGPLTLTRCSLDSRADGYRLSVSLTSETCQSITLTEARIERGLRGRTVRAWDRRDHELELPQWSTWRGGFEADTNAFVNRIQGREEFEYVRLTDVVSVAYLSEHISGRAALAGDESG